MAKKRYNDSLLGKSVPSAKVPWCIILCLLAAIVLVYMGFLRSPAKLLGPPIHQNEYLRVMHSVPLSAPSPAPAPPSALPLTPAGN